MRIWTLAVTLLLGASLVAGCGQDDPEPTKPKTDAAVRAAAGDLNARICDDNADTTTRDDGSLELACMVNSEDEVHFYVFESRSDAEDAIPDVPCAVGTGQLMIVGPSWLATTSSQAVNGNLVMIDGVTTSGFCGQIQLPDAE